MPQISGSVGKNGNNAPEDVVLVEAMLVVLRRTRNRPYLSGGYDGKDNSRTEQAIRAFQADNGLLSGSNGSGGSNGGNGSSGEPPGLVSPGSPTLNALNSELPAAYQSMRVLPGGGIAYLEGSAAALESVKKDIQADLELEANFRLKLADLATKMYETHGIVLSTAPTGRRRNFAKQATQKGTDAGPGESNHNYGLAVDFGFGGLQWIGMDGQLVKDDWWLNGMNAMNGKQARKFWAARDAIAYGPAGLFPTIKKGDLIHVQAYDDHASNAKALAALLTRVGTMKWEVGRESKPRTYKCDLGMGGDLYDVGTAKQIWAGSARVDKKEIAAARSKKSGTVVKASAVSDADLKAMKIALRSEFEAADVSWRQWAVVP